MRKSKVPAKVTRSPAQIIRSAEERGGGKPIMSTKEPRAQEALAEMKVGHQITYRPLKRGGAYGVWTLKKGYRYKRK